MAKCSWKGVAIVAYAPDGEPRGRFDDPNTAVKSGINSGNLYQGLTKGKVVNGFKWMAEEDFIPLYLTDRDKLKWKRDPDKLYGEGVKGKRGFKKGHSGIDTWKKDRDNEERKAKCRKNCEVMHKRNAELISSGQFIGNKKKVMCIGTGKVFDNMSEAAKSVGRTVASLSEACKEFHRCGGYYWKIIV